MNKVRRKKLDELYGKIEELRQDLEAIFDEETEARDNIPESLMETDRYQVADEACDNLEYALDNMQEALDSIESAME